MKLAISNIAWERSEDEAVRGILAETGVRAIEIAPTKIWPDPSDVSSDEALRYRKEWSSRGFQLIAMQALLFGRPEMTIFESAERRSATRGYLHKMMELAARLGIRALVFGSPKNRLAGSIPKAEAQRVAIEFFHGLGEDAARLGVQLCIEPNPAQYGCDFVRTVQEGVSLVDAVDSAGFHLHVDSSALILNEENVEAALAVGLGCMSHFHISDPYLAIPGTYERIHEKIAAQLRTLGYRGFASIEMRSGQTAPNTEAVQHALGFARRIYGRNFECD